MGSTRGLPDRSAERIREPRQTAPTARHASAYNISRRELFGTETERVLGRRSHFDFKAVKEILGLKLLLIAIFAACMAYGSIIVSLDGPPVPILSGTDAGDYLYSYTAVLAGDESLDPAATGGASCLGVGGILTECVPSGTF